MREAFPTLYSAFQLVDATAPLMGQMDELHGGDGGLLRAPRLRQRRAANCRAEDSFYFSSAVQATAALNREG
jgi:hypothetical protein